MTKIIAKVFATLFVIVVIGAIGIAFLQVYSSSKAFEQDVVAQTYIKKVVLSFNTEDLSEFKEHLHPELAKYLETKEGIQLISFLSKIGTLKTIDESKWVSSKSAASTAKGKYEFSNYEVQATFENGKGLVKVSTIPNGDGYFVTNFQIFSEYYATLQ
ncbi:hypothetical protein [Vibrio atypicus]|uniref:hypothetical protein n=1 Tax=Vibrio atypicus TaxID=558271 RepID=UPI001359A770|nr:hypothetical protein [Vibrio atypicus]